MSKTYPPQSSSPHVALPPGSDGAYRSAPPSAPQYHIPHMPMPPQSQMNIGYGDRQYPVSRPSLPELHAGEGLTPLAPGSQPIPSEPKARSVVHEGKRYELQVVQQPRRARMCGFGDKDRRPITPPPCVRLVITDLNTGKEVDCNDIDHGMFVLNVDLWSEDGQREVNLVRHSASSPSISATTPVSYNNVSDSLTTYSNILPGQPGIKYEHGHPTIYGPGGYNSYPAQHPSVAPFAHQSQPQYGAGQYHVGYAQPANGSQQYQPPNGYSQPPSQHMYYAGPGGAQPSADYSHPPPPQPLSYASRPYQPGVADIPIQRAPVSSTAPTGMFTRNLIGSLSASAFRLTDPHDKIGIWFVLQDLSVRTEGQFRLRFSFVNVGVPAPSSPQDQSQAMATVNTGKAPVLASCYSDVFHVYSAKRFPGVVESTSLSKCFATQGIKIPIRKDGPAKDKNAEYDDE